MSVSLLGTSVHGHIFRADERSAWIKVDGVKIGELQQFTVETRHCQDIGKLLDNLVGRPDVAVVAYDASRHVAIIRSGFDMFRTADSIRDDAFTTYVVKSKAHREKTAAEDYLTEIRKPMFGRHHW